MSIFNNMFGNNNQLPKKPTNPQETVMAILGQMKNQGRITEDQYNSLIKNQNNPQEMVQILLQNGLVSNDQVARARQNASLFGIK